MNVPVKVKNQYSESRNIPECRIAYPYLHERREKNAAGIPFKNGPRFDVTILLPKLADAASCPNYKILSDMCMEAAGKMWPGHGWPAGANWPIKDGDVPYVSKPKPGVAPKTPEQIAATNAWRKGHWVIEATNNLKDISSIATAVMVNGVMQDIPAKIVNGVQYYKSGDYGIPYITVYAYQNETFGANFSIDGMLFTRPGEPIGSSGPKSTSAMFGNVAPPSAAPQPNPALVIPSVQHLPPGQAAPSAPLPPLAPPAPTPSVPMPPVAPGQSVGQSAGLPPFPRPA